MKPLPEKSLDVFCQIYTQSRGHADSTCPADDFHVSCLGALERRGLIVWDTERIGGKMKRWCALTKYGAKVGCEQLAVMPGGTNASRNRVCMSIFLDLNNDDHYTAWQVAQSLKNERIFTPTIVDFLTMHNEFLNGEDTTFAKAYPGMYKLMSESRLEDALAQVEQLIRNAPQSLENAAQSSAGAPVGIKALTVKPIAAPTFDDDDEDLITVSRDANAGTQANANFIKSMLALQQNK